MSGRKLAVICAAALLSLSAAATASPPGPQRLETGFALLPGTENGLEWAQRAHSLDARWVRIAVPWSFVAPRVRPAHFSPGSPGDAHYSWLATDIAVKDAAAHHQGAVLTIVGFIPRWAETRPPRGALPGTWRPRPAEVAAFAHAVAARYSGRYKDPNAPGAVLPRETVFQIWNEPNLRTYLEPQWTRRGRGYVPASPDIYRAMLNAAYPAIKSVSSRNTVLAAGIAPYGDAPGVDRMKPLVFLRSLLCLRGRHLDPAPCPVKARLDGLDVHPYARVPTSSARDPDNISLPDIGRLQRVLNRARQTRRVLPAGSKPIWVTEIGWTTNPPDPGGIAQSLQARYLARAMFELWRQGISRVFWLEIRDPRLPTGNNLTGSGLYSYGGRAKPSAQAFRFPFVALPFDRNRQLVVWGRAPSAGRILVEVRSHGAWRAVTALHTSSGGIFYATIRRPPRGDLRAVLRGTQTLNSATV